MSLKKTPSTLDPETKVETDNEELRLKRQSLRRVEPESELLRQYDERVGAPLSELWAIDKESSQRREQIDQGLVRESPIEVIKETKKPLNDLEQRLEELENSVSPRYNERKPRPLSETFDRKPRNIVVDYSQPNKPETVAHSSYFPTPSYASRIDSSKPPEPEIRASVDTRVESAPSIPQSRHRAEVTIPSRKSDAPRPRSSYASYSSHAYAPKPFNAERNSFSDLARDQPSSRASEPPRPGDSVTYNFRLSSRQQGGSPRLSRPEREPEPRPTTYRPKSLERDHSREDGQNVVTRYVVIFV